MKKKKYLLRLQKLNTNRVQKRICHTINIYEIVNKLGQYGYHVINYCEYNSKWDTIKLASTGKKY